jgi:LAO/AO transport system kinase
MDWESGFCANFKCISGCKKPIQIVHLAALNAGCFSMQETDFIRLKEGLFRGERLALSKAITLCETSNSVLHPFRDRLLEAAESANPGTKSSIRLAVTGVPGAGKSTLINALGMAWVRQGYKVAVLAIDPTSELSLGSVLGDKTRMAELSREENAFIRPSATRLHLGGVASTTYETILLCEAAGFNRILVETVGVGQSELEVSQYTDACLLLLVAGAGDELQAVKRGVLEAADFILINKADGENLERARSAARELSQVSSLWATRPGGNRPLVHVSSSLEVENLNQWIQPLEAFFSEIWENGFLIKNRSEQRRKWFRKILWSRLDELLRNQQSLSIFLNELEMKKEKGAGLFDILSELNSRVRIEIK